MTHFYPPEKTEEYKDKALRSIAEEKLLPVPDNYELWFVYFSGFNPELNRTVDEFIAKDGHLTEDACQQIHQEFFEESRQSEQVRYAGDKIRKTIEGVNSAVIEVKESTNEYNHTLENVTAQLKEDKTKEEISEILGGVLEDTKGIMNQNAQLEELLEESALAMKTLHRDLELARKAALTDDLTGLSNRKAFDQEIEKIAEQACSTNGETFTFLMLDIDHFKSFNDTFGHQVGDQVLRLVARTLKDGVKGRDITARYGGEEFAIILPETRLQSALRVAEYLRQNVAKKEVVNRATGERLARITISIGVSEYEKEEPIENLISRADSALYAAKHNGRNQVAAAPISTNKK